MYNDSLKMGRVKKSDEGCGDEDEGGGDED